MERENDPSSIEKVSNRTPRPLTGPALAFDLSAEAQILRAEWPWREHGHNARTLIKHSGFRIVLVVLQAGKRVPEHETYEHVGVHALRGRLRVHAQHQPLELSAGGLLGLDRWVPYDIEALEESELLIWLGWTEE